MHVPFIIGPCFIPPSDITLSGRIGDVLDLLDDAVYYIPVSPASELQGLLTSHIQPAHVDAGCSHLMGLVSGLDGVCVCPKRASGRLCTFLILQIANAVSYDCSNNHSHHMYMLNSSHCPLVHPSGSRELHLK